MIKKILWASDGSTESNSSLRYVSFLAGRFNAEVLGLYVSEIQYPITMLYPTSEEYIIKIAETSEKKFENKFESLSKKFADQDVAFSYKIIRDSVVDGIIKTAKNNNCDLIIMGKHGLGFFERTILGSNTAKVLRRSSVPVLSVRGKGRKKIADISRILVPVDVSNSSGSAIKTSLEYAQELNASVTFLYVFWLNEKAYDVPPMLLKKLIAASKRKLDNIVKTAMKKHLRSKKNKKIEFKTEVINGINPGAIISWYAKKMKFDLLVMNTHGRTGVKRLVLGSEAEKIIREVSCPVLVERP